MINLHVLYYRNIWPFEGKDCSLFLKPGKFLIKAPIGSGKSFLFFDGPTYALYKSSKRNLLNIRSKEGEISLIFSEGEQYYLIKRSLTHGRKYDSCTSRLRAFKSPPTFFDHISKPKSLIQRGENYIQEILHDPSTELEEIPIKNETDLQQMLNQLLPPEPVFLSTIFLLQDAENIFEMQPADRLIVLKNVFWLLGIDEVKEQVNEEKKQIELKIKNHQDQTLQNNKLRKRLKEAHELAKVIDIPTGNTFFDEIEPLRENLTLQDFSLNGLNNQHFIDNLEKLKLKEKEFITLKATQEQFQKQLTEKKFTITNKQQEEKKLNEDILQLEQRIARIDLQKIEEVKKEKITIYQQLQNLENIEKKIQFEDLAAESLEEVIALIQKLKERGKELANLVQIQQLKKEELEKAKTRLINFDKGVETETVFTCTKIGGNCPFIQEINKQHFSQLEQQRITMKQEIEKLEASFRTEYQQAIQLEIDRIKDFLHTINFSIREEKHQQKIMAQKHMQFLDQQIMQMETEVQKLQTYQQEKSALLSRAEENKKHILSTQTEIIKLEEENNIFKAQLNSPEVQQITKQIHTLEQFLQIIQNIEQLISDFTEIKNIVKHLELRREKLKNLYTILSKELLFTALGTDLPILSEIINTYLTQVVDYQLSMFVTESGEKIELEVKIIDAKGEREVKSLSGWQRIILKLVWMLAISSYLNTPLLFLDETINNLDAETVGKVGEMIDNFVKQRTMKFYTVTHNPEIQEMDIRDEIIEIR